MSVPKDKEKQVKTLLNKLADKKNLPAWLYDALAGWLVSEDSKDEKERQLAERFDNEIYYEPSPSADAYNSYRRFSRRIRLKNNTKIPLRRHLVFKVAAVLIPALVIAGAAWMWSKDGSDDSSQFIAEVTVSVTEGLPKQVTLSDESEVWVNSGSKLEYDDHLNNKRVARLEGEAYFKVRRDESKPFVVKTEHLEINVLGTEFNVRTHESDGLTEVVLASGSVRVKTEKGKHTLKPGQMLVYDHSSGKTEIAEVEVSKKVEWRSPVQSLSNRPLSDILNTVCEYYGYTLDLRCNLSDETYSVAFSADEPIESILRALSISCKEFTYEINGNTVVIKNIN